MRAAQTKKYMRVSTVQVRVLRSTLQYATELLFLSFSLVCFASFNNINYDLNDLCNLSFAALFFRYSFCRQVREFGAKYLFCATFAVCLRDENFNLALLILYYNNNSFLLQLKQQIPTDTPRLSLSSQSLINKEHNIYSNKNDELLYSHESRRRSHERCLLLHGYFSARTATTQYQQQW